jgi:electron transport complex protein RnfC
VCPWTLPGRFHHEESTDGLPEIDTIVIKGVNEEPTVFTFETLLEKQVEDIKSGMDFLEGVAPRASVILTVPKRLEGWASKEFDGKAKVVALSDQYKERIERFAVPRISNKTIPNTFAYRRKGVGVLSVEYLIAMIDALEGKGPFTEKHATIAGDSLSKTVLVRFPIGTTIRTILHDLGLDNVPYSRLLVGGPMKGAAQFTDDIPITKSGHGVYLVSEEKVPPDVNLPCINCGRCTRACPANLQVHLIGRYVEHNLVFDTGKFHPEACNECGLCAYVCPAHRPLVQMIKLCNQQEDK